MLWIHFLVNAPFGIALGFDKETPGLMSLRPRPRGQSVLTRGVFITCGLVGLFMAVANLAIIEIGEHAYDSVAIGQSIGLVAFALMLVAAAYECRSETETVFRMETFNSAKLNWVALAEVVGAFLLTQSDFLRGLLGTTQLNAEQWGLALFAAVALVLTWELGKWIARRAGSGRRGHGAPMAPAAWVASGE